MLATGAPEEEKELDRRLSEGVGIRLLGEHPEPGIQRGTAAPGVAR